jgi:hypothetical protein
MAGKAFVWDYFKASQIVAAGADTWDKIAGMMRVQNISYETIDPRTRTDSLFWRCPPLASSYAISTEFSLKCE